jgi:hypothetical protein
MILFGFSRKFGASRLRVRAIRAKMRHREEVIFALRRSRDEFP